MDDALWTTWPLGVRVVVRRRLADGKFGDVLGDLLETGPDGVLVRTRAGDVRVTAPEIAIGKIVPPARPRRPRPTADAAADGAADED